MLRTPLTGLQPRALFGKLLNGLLFTGLVMSSHGVRACTAAELHAVAHDSAGSTPSVIAKVSGQFPSASSSPPAGPVLRAPNAESVTPIALLAPTTPTALTPENANAHATKPLAMLVAALALMVSIALRRYGKR